MNSNDDGVNNNKQQEIHVFPFEKIEVINYASNSIQPDEKKSGSKKRKSTIPRKISLFPDFSLTENDVEVTSHYIANEEFSPMENEWKDSIDESYPNLFQFIKENNDEESNSNNVAHEGIEDSLVLPCSNHSLNERIGLNDSQKDSDFEVSTDFERNAQKQIIDENWDFCKIAMASDTNTVLNFLSSSIVTKEDSIMEANYTESLVNDTERNHVLSPRQNMYCTTIFEDDRVTNKECHASHDQVQNKGMEINKPLDITSSLREKPKSVIQDDNQAVQCQEILDATDSDMINWSCVNWKLLGRNWGRVVSTGSSNFNNLQMLSCYSEDAATLSDRINNSKKESAKWYECQCTEVEMINEKDLHYTHILRAETPANKITIINQTTMTDTEEQTSIHASHNKVQNKGMEINKPLDITSSFGEEPTSVIQDNNQAVHCQEILDATDSVLDMINFEERVVSTGSSNFNNLQMLSCYSEDAATLSDRINNRKKESAIKWDECESADIEIIDEKYLHYADILYAETPANKNTIINQTIMTDTEEQTSIQSNSHSVSFNGCTSIQTPTISHADMSAHQISPESFTSEENIKFENDSEQTKVENNKVPLLGKRKIQSKHSNPTKRKRLDLKQRSLEFEHTIFDLIKEYMENTNMKKKFSFEDIADFVTKNAPNATYFKVLHTVRIFFVNNLKATGFNLFA